MAKQKKCNHCGQLIVKTVVEKTVVEEEVVIEKGQYQGEWDEDALVEKVVKRAVKEVINTIQPLLEKLKVITEEHNKAAQNGNPMQAQEQQLLQLQAETQKALQDRLLQRERSMGFRMQKFRNKTAGNFKNHS